MATQPMWCMGRGPVLRVRRGGWGRKISCVSPIPLLRDLLILFTYEKNPTRRPREETLCPNPGSLPPPRATQKADDKGMLDTDPNEQESGQRQREIFSSSLIYFCFKIFSSKTHSKVSLAS